MEPLTDGEEGGDVPNEKNLVSNGQRTPNERRENARKAGKASGAARRRKKQAAQYMRILMETAATEELARKLQEQGFDEEDCTYAAALAWKMLMQGLKGNVKAQSSYEASARTAEYYKTRPCAAKVESAARIFAEYLLKVKKDF